MPAQVLNLVGEYKVEQGADYILEVTVNDTVGVPYSLVGASAAAQIRETIDAVPKIEFVCVVDEATSVITLSLTAVVTAGIDYTEGFWDCELTEADGVVTRLLYGDVDISPEVTRA
uniref:Putative tail protein n=1 Tax=viral metagenome TaxID=1070528 RepID=A0A6M3KMZ3_9ZZZZ